jgi:O-antigen/teichoic acid export membrane protein
LAFLTILKHTKNYFSASIAVKALGFVSIPVLTRLLSLSEYGILNVFMSFVGLMTVILSLNAYTSIGRYWYEKQNDFNRFLGTSVYLAGISVGLSFLLFVVFCKPLGRIFGLPGNMAIWLIPFVVVGIIFSVFQQVYQPQLKSKLIARISIAKVYLGFGAGVCLVLLMEKNRYYGVIWGQLIVGVLVSGIIIRLLVPYFKSAFERKHLRYIAGYSLPLIPYALSGTILAQFDRIMINSYIGSDSAGLYSLAYNVGMLLSILSGALLTAWIPVYFKDMDNRDYRKVDSDIDKMFRLVLVGGMFLMFFGEEIGKLLADEKYHSGLIIVPVVVFGYIFASLGPYWGINIDFAKKTIWTSIVMLSAGTANILLNAVFIPKYGYIAGAYTTVASYMLMSFMCLVVSKFILKLHTVPVIVAIKPLLSLILFYAFSILIFTSKEFPLWQTYSIKALLFFGFCLLIVRPYITGFKQHSFQFLRIK